MRHVLQIRREEFDWLDNCEHVGYMRRQIRGNLGTVQEEIESHEVRETAKTYCIEIRSFAMTQLFFFSFINDIILIRPIHLHLYNVHMYILYMHAHNMVVADRKRALFRL